MKNYITGWSKEELKIYTLIYCANADYFESRLEIQYIKSKVKESDYDKIYVEFKSDNDFTRIQKINQTVKALGYTNEEKDILFDEMRELFLTDAKYHTLEQNLQKALNNIIH